MSDDAPLSADRAAQMRAAFDRAFAEPLPPVLPPGEELLAVRIGAEPYALRLSEISGLYAERKITPLPGSIPSLLGLAGFRGAIVPVYDAARLLGHPSEEAPRWLAMAAGGKVAFAFAALDGHLRVARDAIVGHVANEHARRFVRDFARAADLMLPIVHVPSLHQAIRQQLAAALNPEER